MKTRPYLLVSAALFGAVALLHLVRAVLEVPIVVGRTPFSVGLSWGGLLAAALLSIWGFRLAARSPRG